MQNIFEEYETARANLRKALLEYPTRDKYRNIMIMRYLPCMSYRDIGKEYNITDARVGQIIDREEEIVLEWLEGGETSIFYRQDYQRKLSQRTINALVNAEIHTIEEAISKIDLKNAESQIRGLGKKGTTEVINLAKEKGII